MICLAAALSAVATNCAFAGEGSGTESPLLLGTGARALAMGRAASALGEGPEIVSWNPALLARADVGEFALFHSDLYTDATSFRSGFVSYPTLDFGTFGAGIQRIGVGGIEERSDRNSLLGEFSASETHVLAGYGRRLHRWLMVGANLRIVQQSVGGTSATGAGMDLGLATQYPLRKPGHSLHGGLVLQNLVQPSLRLDQEEVVDPRRIKVGLGYRLVPPTSRFGGVAALEFELPEEADTRWGLGLEGSFDRMFFLRGGLDRGDVTAGLGARVRGIELAYAMSSHPDLPREDRFTLSMRFGSSVSDRRLALQQSREAELGARLEAVLAQREADAAETARREAEAAWVARDYEHAVVLYRRLQLLAPDDANAGERIDASALELALQAAQHDLDAGEPARAVTGFQRILDHWPGEARALAGLTTSRRLIAAAADRQEQIDALFADALERYGAGDPIGAGVSLREILTLEPDHAAARGLIAQVEQARSREVESRLGAAWGAAQDENYSRAIGLVRGAIELAPEREAELDGLIDQWTMESQAMLAARRRTAIPTPAVQSAPVRRLSTAERADLDRRFREGMSSFESGNYEAATRSWRDVWERDHEFADVADYLVRAHLLLGIRAYSDGAYTRALDQCHRALEVQPDNDKALRYVARIEEERAGVEGLSGSEAGE